MPIKLTHPSFSSTDQIQRYLALLCREIEQSLMRLDSMCSDARITSLVTSREGDVPRLKGVGRSDDEIDNELSDYFFTRSRGYRRVIYTPALEHSLLGGQDILVECYLSDGVGWQRAIRVDGDGCDICIRGYTAEGGWSAWSVR